MKLYVQDKYYDFSREELEEMRLGSGEEGTVYRMGDFALKVYHASCAKIRLSEDACQKMYSISSHYVFLPRGPIRDESKKFNGYFENVLLRDSFGDIPGLKMPVFIQQIDGVYDDLSLLSNHHILVADFRLDNCYYDDGFYFYDPGSFTIEKDFSYQDLQRKNRKVFNDFLIHDVFTDFIFCGRQKKRLKLEDYFLGCDYLPDIIKEDAKENETLKKYLKRITS